MGIQHWPVGPIETFTIPNAADGSAVAAVDLGGNFKGVLIKCEDCQYIAATTTVGAKVGYTGSDTLSDLYEQDDPGTIYAGGNLPTTGTLAFVLTHAFGVRRIQLILSNNASGGPVVFKIQGLDKGS